MRTGIDQIVVGMKSPCHPQSQPRTTTPLTFSTPQRSTTPPISITPHIPSSLPKSPRTSTQGSQRQRSRKRKCSDSAAIEDVFVRSEMKSAREDNRERDKMLVDLERERIRQRYVELGQREMELQLQTQWLELFRKGLNVLERYLNVKK